MKRRWSKRSSSHLSTEETTAEEPSAFKIVNINYQISGGESDHDLKIGGFLERCHYCKKRIANDSEIFMYGNFRGFCTVECRENQMIEDRLAKDQQKINPKKNAVGCEGQSSSYK